MSQKKQITLQELTSACRTHLEGTMLWAFFERITFITDKDDYVDETQVVNFKKMLSVGHNMAQEDAVKKKFQAMSTFLEKYY